MAGRASGPRLPELPAERRARFIHDYGLREYDADVLTATRTVAEYFEAVATRLRRPEGGRQLGDDGGAAQGQGRAIAPRRTHARCTPAALAGLMKLVENGTTQHARRPRTVFETMWATGEDARTIVEREGLAQVSDEGAIEAAIADVIAASPEQVADVSQGKDQLLSAGSSGR